MKPIWRARTSLFARMSLIFGLLVAVPLAVSGLVLSLVGRYSMLSSGEAMAGVGQRAVASTRVRLVDAVTRNLEQVTNDVSNRAQKALEEASREHVRTSRKAVDRATEEIVGHGKNAFVEAGRRSAGVGRRAVSEAATELREVHRESLTTLKNEFVQKTRQELNQAAAAVEPEMRRSVLALARGINEQKVMALISAGQRGLDEVLYRLSDVSRHRYVQEFDDQSAPATMQRLVKLQPRSLPVNRAILISPAGEEIVRLPDGGTAQNWRGSPELREAQERALTIMPLRAGPDGKQHTLRLVQQVTPLDPPAPPNRPVYGALVADVQLDNVAEMVTGPSRESTLLLLVTKEGRVLSSRGSHSVGGSVPELHEELRRVEQQAATEPQRVRIRDDQGRPYLAVAQQWSMAGLYLTAPSNIFAVVAQPESEALRPLQELQPRVIGAWQNALDNVGDSSADQINQRMREVRPRQEAIAARAADTINRNIRGVADTVPGALRASRNRILKDAENTISSQARQATGQTVKEIYAARDALARSARGRLHYISEAEALKGMMEVQHKTKNEANLGAGRMILNSAWLIFVFVLLALALATITTRSIVSPINRLVLGTQALAAGDYSQRIRVESEDELGRLATAFNEMAVAVETGQAEIRESHDSLVAQKQRIQTIVDSSPDGLVMIEPNGQIGFMNPAAREMLRVSRSAVPAGAFDLDQLPAPAADVLRQCLAELQVGGPAAELDLEGDHRRVLQYRGVAIPSDADRRPGLLLHLHDVTRERQIDEMKTDFISLVSHELRTPLTSILGFSSYVLTGKLGEISEPQRRALDSIHRQAKRLSAIISDFLDVSRIESGKVEMRRDPVAVDSVARRVVADLHPQAAEKSIQVQARVLEADGAMVALGDEARIAQVFTNLIGNALKFTEPEGRVDVLLSRRNGEVVCRVRDTGCGIPADELERVFDRFYQVEKVVTRKSGGTGLGLAIVKNIVEAHGGRIGIESEVGQGTEVTFSLPAGE